MVVRSPEQDTNTIGSGKTSAYILYKYEAAWVDRNRGVRTGRIEGAGRCFERLLVGSSVSPEEADTSKRLFRHDSASWYGWYSLFMNCCRIDGRRKNAFDAHGEETERTPTSAEEIDGCVSVGGGRNR